MECHEWSLFRSNALDSRAERVGFNIMADKTDKVVYGVVLGACLIAGPIGWFLIALDLLDKASGD
jgi:uncharacterized membrane protein